MLGQSKICGNFPLLTGLLVLVISAGGCTEDKYQKFVTVGDSLTEGTQSSRGLPFFMTQPNGYAKRISYKILEDPEAQFKLPLLTVPLPTNLDPTGGRRRIDSSLRSPNLGVDGFTVRDLLQTPATAKISDFFFNQVDRVMYPRTGTVIDAAVAEDPELLILWIGANDVLGAVINPPEIDGVSYLTPVDQFRGDYEEVVRKLNATGADMVIATIPKVTIAAYLLDGKLFGFPDGFFVPLPVALGVLSGALGPEALLIPGNIMDPLEVAAINAHTEALNAVITEVASAQGIPVLDVYSWLEGLAQAQPIKMGPFSIGLDYAPAFSATGTSGFFSLDGFHPSNTGYALVGNEFIKIINQNFGKEFELLDIANFVLIDPYVDNDGDGLIEGPGFFPPLPGVTGDCDDTDPTVGDCDSTPGKALSGPGVFAESIGLAGAFLPVRASSRPGSLEGRQPSLLPLEWRMNLQQARKLVLSHQM